MKRIFLTGASSGIGLATAQALLARGDEVWGSSRNPASLPRHERFHPVALDLHNDREIEETFAKAVIEAGHFDVVINNAGSGHFGPAELLSPEETTNQLQVVFFAHVRLMQLALAEMRRHDHGLIINVTSLASLLPVPFMGAYNAAKSAMASFTMSLQIELGNTGVRIVDLQPGDIRTNFNDAVHWNIDTGYKERVANNAKDRPSGRCLPHSVTDFDGHFTPRKVVQTPGLLIMLFESYHAYRQIFTDGRGLPEDREPAWYGYSAGKWDGDTLVVDTVGLNEQTWLDDTGHPHSDALHIIERFRRLDFGHMQVQLTIDDPKAYKKPWTATIPWEFIPDTDLLDWVCENEKDNTHMSGK